MKKIHHLFYTSLVLTILLTACSKSFLDPTLEQSKSVESGTKTVEDLQLLLNGLYNRIQDVSYYGRDFIIYGEVRSDNAFSNLNSGRFESVSKFSQTTADGYANGSWAQIYKVIASANIILGKQLSVAGTDSVKLLHIYSQAYAARALAYFNLLSIYGQAHVTEGKNLGVPLVTVYKAADLLPARSLVADVEVQIEKDFNLAITNAQTDLDDAPIYITKNAIYALLSRYYIYVGNYAKAKDAANQVILSDNYSVIEKDGYVDSWGAAASSNSIFELFYDGTDNLGNTSLGQIYFGQAYGDIQITTDLYNIYEPGDIRRDAAIISKDGNTVRNIGKFPSVEGSNNLKIIRYEEVILNYAEALLETGDAATALTYLNQIPEKRGATLYTEATKTNILLERRKELAFEGFRFFDLLRTQSSIPKVDVGQLFTASIPYGDYRLAFPIPQLELDANANVVQNIGYY